MTIKKFTVSIFVLTVSSYLSWEMVNQSVYAAPAVPSVCQPEGTKVCRDEFRVIRTPRHGGSSATCKPDFFPTTPRLCFTRSKSEDSYANAEALCREIGGRVADYGDWRYRILFLLGGGGVATAPPLGIWLGPITADNRALYVSVRDEKNFDGESDRFLSRKYVCAHDR